MFVHCFLQAKACTYTWCIPVQVFLKLVKGWALDVQFVVFPHVTQGKLSCQTMSDCGTFSTLNQSLNCIMYDRFVECGKSCWCLQGNKRQTQHQLSKFVQKKTCDCLDKCKFSSCECLSIQSEVYKWTFSNTEFKIKENYLWIFCEKWNKVFSTTFKFGIWFKHKSKLCLLCLARPGQHVNHK